MNPSTLSNLLLSLALVFAQEPDGPVWVPEKLIRIVGFEQKQIKRKDTGRREQRNLEFMNHSAGASIYYTLVLWTSM